MKIKEKLPQKEAIFRTLMVIAVVIISVYAKDSHKQVINSLAFLFAFFCSIYLHRYFYPLFVAAMFFYLIASLQELWNANYAYLTITKIYWTIGNILLPIGLIDFIYRLLFKYKIAKDEN